MFSPPSLSPHRSFSANHSFFPHVSSPRTVSFLPSSLTRAHLQLLSHTNASRFGGGGLLARGGEPRQADLAVAMASVTFSPSAVAGPWPWPARPPPCPPANHAAAAQPPRREPDGGGVGAAKLAEWPQRAASPPAQPSPNPLPTHYSSGELLVVAAAGAFFYFLCLICSSERR